jgi:hypothetical protein
LGNWGDKRFWIADFELRIDAIRFPGIERESKKVEKILSRRDNRVDRQSAIQNPQFKIQ